jgi:hypothetical protein
LIAGTFRSALKWLWRVAMIETTSFFTPNYCSRNVPPSTSNRTKLIGLSTQAAPSE